MSLLPSKPGYGSKIELKSKECIDTILQPLTKIELSFEAKLSQDKAYPSTLKL